MISQQPPGRDLLVTLKSAAGLPGPQLLIPVGRPATAFLRVVATHVDRQNPEDVQALTQWRNRYVGAFLTEFDATVDRTSRWLAETVGGNDRKVLFMLDDAAGRTLGFMGLDFIDWRQATGEADAIVRGREAPRGTMTAALRTLMAWALGSIGLRGLGVRVRSDNTALDFYRKVGFVERQRVPLRLEIEPGLRRWVESTDALDSPLSLVHMKYPDPAEEIA